MPTDRIELVSLTLCEGENSSGIARMQQLANKTRFLMGFSLDGRFADSERLVTWGRSIGNVAPRGSSAYSHQLLGELARRFQQVAETAFSFRDLERLEEASRVLINLPLIPAKRMGLFYQGLFLKRTGQVDKAQSRFDLIANSGPLSERARAIQALGALHFDRGQRSEAFRYQLEAGRMILGDHNPLLALLVQLELSHIQADAGDHLTSLAGLERLASLVRIVGTDHPLYYYFYHNALAVEFSELGRLAEARAASAVALASPFAHAYPEWSETRDEIALKLRSASPSVVAIHRTPETASARRPSQRRKSKRSRVVISTPSANDTFSYQRSTTEFPAKPIVFPTAADILGRMLSCIGPRAPPLS